MGREEVGGLHEEKRQMRMYAKRVELALSDR